jgi:hypothetical protein
MDGLARLALRDAALGRGAIGAVARHPGEEESSAKGNRLE